MTTATAQGPAPLEAWDDDQDDIESYTTLGHAAGSIAWKILTHAAGEHGPNVASNLALAVRLPAPDGLDADGPDLYAFLWELVGDAARIGYTFAKMEAAMPGATRFGENGQRFTSEAAMALGVAAVLGFDVVADRQVVPS